MKRLLCVSLSLLLWHTLFAQNILPIAKYSYGNEYKINQSYYRIVQTQCGDKLFYYSATNACWENIELFVCDTTGCAIYPISIESLYKEGNLLIISYQCVDQALWKYIYLDKRGFPNWKMTENEEEWQRY